jgi:hypothetical protein
MGAMGPHPGAATDIVVSGRARGDGRKRGKPPRRWPWILGALLLVVAGIVIVVIRPVLGAANFRALQARWSEVSALDVNRATTTNRLAHEATPSDLAAVTAAVLALQHQEANRLAVLRAGIGPGLARDAAVSALAAAARTAISREISDLRSREPLTGWSIATYAAVDRVQSLLAADQLRFGVSAPAVPRLAPLTAANGALLRLQRPLDEGVQADLLVVSGNGNLEIIDLRSGVVRAPPAALRRLGLSVGYGRVGYGGLVLPETGFVAAQAANGGVYAVSPGMVPRLLGRGSLYPAASQDAVWLWSGNLDNGQPGQLTLVTGSGRRIAGPVPGLSYGGLNAGTLGITGLTVLDGFVVAPSIDEASQPSQLRGLWLWNPLAGSGLRPLVRGCADAIAAHGALLAWLRCYPDAPFRLSLHITNTATGADRLIVNPSTAIPFLGGQLTAAFSPNGKWLADYYSGAMSGGYALGLVNTQTGAVSIIHGAPISDATQTTTPMLWTADSTRVFYDTGGSQFNNADPWADDAVPFATYRLGNRSAIDMRFHDTSATLLAVLPSPAG